MLCACVGKVASRSYLSNLKKELFQLARLLLLNIDPEFAADNNFAVQFSKMTNCLDHHVKRHTGVLLRRVPKKVAPV